MRDYQTKANQGGAPDSITSTKLGAGEANSVLTENKTAVERAGLTIAGADGSGEDTTQLAQAIFINSVKASTFADSGSANAYQLTPVSGSTGVLLPGGYGALNGMKIYFVPSANNTGNTTINVGQTVGTLLGSKKALTLAGGEIPSGALLASRLASFTYDASADSGTGAWILDGSYDASGQFLPLTGGTMTGSIAMGSNKVTGLAAATANGDALRYEQLVGQYLPLSGGTVTGAINSLGLDNTSSLLTGMSFLRGSGAGSTAALRTAGDGANGVEELRIQIATAAILRCIASSGRVRLLGAPVDTNDAATKGYVDGLALGVGQTWQDVSGSRVASTVYQNTTGKPIQVNIAWNNITGAIEWSPNGSSGWVDASTQGGAGGIKASTVIIPVAGYYRTTSAFTYWSELR